MQVGEGMRYFNLEDVTLCVTFIMSPPPPCLQAVCVDFSEWLLNISSKDSEGGWSMFFFTSRIASLWTFKTRPCIDYSHIHDRWSSQPCFSQHGLKNLPTFRVLWTHTCHGGIAAVPALVAAVPAVDECGTNGLCGAGVVAKRTALSQRARQSNFLGSSIVSTQGCFGLLWYCRSSTTLSVHDEMFHLAEKRAPSTRHHTVARSVANRPLTC